MQLNSSWAEHSEGEIMSWSSYQSTSEVEMKATGHLRITWECQRCGARQTEVVFGKYLLSGVELECKNTEVCGEKQSYIGIAIEVTNGLHKGLLDRPLKKSAQHSVNADPAKA